MGLRAPVAVLKRYRGDCDSKSLLAGVMLKELGFPSAVLSRKRHAVLGVALPGLAGTRYRVGGKSYLVVEMTVVRRPGDVRSSGMSRGSDPKRLGWRLDPI